jgi:glycosyltransferase involved in cell wall biosynthesis
MIDPPPGKILVFIVSYNAERHIEALLERVPRELLASPNVHLLCIDDASGDRTARLAVQWAEARGVKNLSVLRNRVNQGYGGNQKLGYRYAIEGNFDFVILLHGDGQYAPELLWKFIEVWQTSRADVVLGSRMIDLGSALKGGMPLYKLVGNLLLTKTQNSITGKRLSEYHTGYRGYSTSFLKGIPFDIDTNDFHFDTEILLQAFGVGAQVVEFPVPTHYGQEVCHVNGLQYAFRVILATLQYRLHRMGMFCSLKYRNRNATRYLGKTDNIYLSHTTALSLAREQSPKTVLDIGCGQGYVAKSIEATGSRVTGLDLDDPDPGCMTEFHRCDLSREPLPVDPFKFDTVLMLDTIEHLEDPEGFLLRIRNQTKASLEEVSSTTFILSTPNVAFASMRLMLTLGRFNYADRGILDVTHKRLFTRSSLLTMLEDCGYTVLKVIPIGVPFGVAVGGRIGRLLELVCSGLARVWSGMFAFQFMVACRPRPNLRQVLKDSETLLTQTNVGEPVE